MSKALRLSEKWFRRGLWLVAVVFAGFLIGLGGTLVGDLPKVEKPLRVEDFMDRAAGERLRAGIEQSGRTAREAQDALEQARLKRRVAESDTQAARESLQNWLATRRATQLPEQDPEVLARTRQLDALKQAERAAQAAEQRQDQALLDARQAESRARQELQEMEREAARKMNMEARRVELRVFLYRLALTLPLLGVAGWLLRTRRHGTWWPFVWGFALFALFTFFVELVPYLPSYGGYVRYLVGIVVTVLVGRQAILALNRYLERQKAAEQLPDAQRREELSYDTALARLAKGVCPGCERPVDLRDEKIDYCPHCGIGLFDRCGSCATRKSAFAKFCHSCGASAGSAGAGPFTRLVSGPA
ncbi:zinc ribbon domain-containing protein [Ramlibacter monticola]|uniref:Zinc ribbon domain-containing protein n=1 Tax=Ramlibacter monticola TaxID=1926872 RepID=A0A937CUJ9_9BURK|nr:zinc ribbon domain-containing protein [Ramlibacter monticola]MBL0392117.1 zinc ribbon domain-containing protein [Ramlibacter monticola]